MSGVLVLVRGRVKIKIPATVRDGGDISSDDAREAVLAYVSASEMFGESALLPTRSRPEWAEAAEESEVLVIPSLDLCAWMEERPELARSLLDLIGIRRQRVEIRLAGMSLLTCRSRVVRLLLELCETNGDATGDRVEIRIPLSHHDLAGLAGMSRETVTLALGELQSVGLVEVSRRRIVVTNVRRLRREQ
jgi:CRP-like cAMP-binding protein